MKTTPSITASLSKLLLAVGLIATVGTAAASTLEPPTLTSATFIPDSVSGDHIHLLWDLSTSNDVVEEGVYANGKFLFRGPVYTNPFFGHLADVYLKQRGLTGDETFTLTAIDSKGNESAMGKGLTASPLKELPAPLLTSAAIVDDHLVLSWMPTHTDEVSGNIMYLFNADNGSLEPGGIFSSAANVNTVTTPLSFSNPNDPTVPTVKITKDTKISIMAEDRTTARSPLSNKLTPTVN